MIAGENLFIERFRKSIQIDTSWREGAEGQLTNFQNFLREAYPAFHKAAERRVVSPYSVVYRWPGSTDGPPVLLLAHYDVVPVEEKKWSSAPFGAEIREENGVQYIYGRGTLDMKNILAALLESVETLCASGFVPKRELWFAFGGDEERSGSNGARKTGRMFNEEGRRFAWALDEGTPVAIDMIKGVRTPLSLVGIEEKGYLSVELTVEQKPGHASQPPDVQAVAVLSRALSRIAKRPFPFVLDPAAEAFFKGVAAYAGGIQGWAMKHARLLGPFFFGIAGKSPAAAAMLRTTTAMTMLKGSAADNVMPSSVCAVLNLRLLPPWTTDKALNYLKETIADNRVALNVYGLANDPTPASPGQEKMIGDGWEEIIRASKEAFPGIPVLPFLMIATTDSRYYNASADAIYRFSPMKLNPEELSRIHGHDERISLENLESGRKFYAALLKSL